MPKGRKHFNPNPKVNFGEGHVKGEKMRKMSCTSLCNFNNINYSVDDFVDESVLFSKSDKSICKYRHESICIAIITLILQERLIIRQFEFITVSAGLQCWKKCRLFFINVIFFNAFALHMCWCAILSMLHITYILIGRILRNKFYGCNFKTF